MHTPQEIYNELLKLQDEILEVGKSMADKSRQAANARAEYERLKSKYIVAMFAEEAEDTWKGKRTEAQRTAMYRSLYAQERLEASLAENEYKAQGEYLKALTAALTALQTRYKLISHEWNAGGTT